MKVIEKTTDKIRVQIKKTRDPKDPKDTWTVYKTKNDKVTMSKDTFANEFIVYTAPSGGRRKTQKVTTRRRKRGQSRRRS